MARSDPSLVLRHLQRILGTSEAGGVPDAQLLEAFVQHRLEPAFELLLWRHGGMVLQVCQDVLRDLHSAEDAFQATFLTLARKASSISRRESLAGWLYRVAYRIALRLRARQARRNSRERPDLDLASYPAGPVSASEPEAREAHAHLHSAVHALPARYRCLVVLCYFEGKSHEEAARQLGWPKGTVAGRLARARELLRKRLVRRGVVPAVGFLALGSSPSTAAVPPSLFAGTLRAALAYAVRPNSATGLVSIQVCQLAEGAIRAMYFSKVKIVVVGFLVAGLALAGGGFWKYGAVAGQRDGGSAAVEANTAQAKRDKTGLSVKAVDPETRRWQILEEARRRNLQPVMDEWSKKEAELEENQEQFHRFVRTYQAKKIESEERLKALERKQAQERERERAFVKEAWPDAWEGPPFVTPRAAEEFEKYRKTLEKREADRLSQMIKARIEQVEIESELQRAVEKQARALGMKQKQLEFLEEQMNALQRTLVNQELQLTHGSSLEQKLDRILKELAELRREIHKKP